MTTNETIDSAIKYYQSGDLLQAEKTCRIILQKQPDNADALHCLGVIYSQSGQTDLAINYIKRALQIDPAFTDAYNNLGNLYQNIKQLDEAIDSYRKALQLNPNSAETYYNLGVCLQDKGLRDEAVGCYRKALQLNFNTYGLFNNLGLALQDIGQLDEAITSYRNAIKLNSDFASAYYNLGNVFRDKEQLDEAINYYQRAIQINPEYSDAYVNLGIAFKDKGRIDEAITSYQKALQINLNNENAYFNLGFAVGEKGLVDEAINYYRKAVQIKPDFADAHWNLSLALLLSGNFTEGWEKYEWRWETKENTSRRYNLPRSLWDGASLKGKNIFVYTEQGVGDEIMFASCLPDVIALADSCVVACDNRLVPLFSRSFPDCKIIEHFDPNDTYPPNLPSIDVKAAIGSLPKFLRPDLRSFSGQKGYLVPETQKLKMWQDRYISLGEGLKVGISWRGGKKLYEKLTRSTVLEQWAGLLSLQGIHYINLQYGDCSKELREAQENFGVTIHNWEDADSLKDLDNFAAQISALDLIISIDNATVHMAGALGVHVWTLLPFACNWRWMLKFEDTPWYPTMRLFRQSSSKNWDEVFDYASKLLREAIEHGNLSSDDWNPSIKYSYKKMIKPALSGLNNQNLLIDRKEKEKDKYLKAWSMDDRVYARYSPGLELSNRIDFLKFLR